MFGGERMTRAGVTVGARAPDFTATDEQGRPWRLADALERSAQVLVFYRGGW